MEKIVIASDNNMVTNHFGHCEEFIWYGVDGGEIIEKEGIKNPGHKPGFLPKYLADLGLNTLITGGIGRKAIDIFLSKDIKVITGASGQVDEVIKAYLGGNLQSTKSICEEHQHKDSCGGH